MRYNDMLFLFYFGFAHQMRNIRKSTKKTVTAPVYIRIWVQHPQTIQAICPERAQL